MRKLAWTAGVLGIGLSAVVGGKIASGADHRDSDLLAMSANSAADINDLYAWTNSDASKLNLVMTVQPFAVADATFSPNVQYVFHVASMASYGAATQTETNVICEFASATSVQCWVGNDYVTGDPSSTAGLNSADGKVKVFAGQRKDPFFFQLLGFKRAVQAGEDYAAANPTMFDANGCIELDPVTAGQVDYMLAHDTTCDAVTQPVDCADTDTFGTLNGVALVLQIDKTLVNSGGPILAVYASTHQTP